MMGAWRVWAPAVAALAVAVGAWVHGHKSGRDACEAAHERERLKTQQELFDAADRLSERERELQAIRDALSDRQEAFENEASQLDLCRATADELRRLRILWGSAD